MVSDHNQSLESGVGKTDLVLSVARGLVCPGTAASL